MVAQKKYEDSGPTQNFESWQRVALLPLLRRASSRLSVTLPAFGGLGVFVPSLNLDLDFFDHPKTKRLVGKAGMPAVLCLIKLWVYCGKYHPSDGIIPDFLDEEIESAVSWTGKPGLLIESLLYAKFIERAQNGIQIHQWEEHEGHIVAYKAKALMMNRIRWEKARSQSSKDSVDNPPRTPSRIPPRTPSAVQCSTGQLTPKDNSVPLTPISGSVEPEGGLKGEGIAFPPEKKPKPAPDPRHAPFILEWVTRWEKQHGSKYAFDGGKDAKAVSRLLTTGIETHELLNLAEESWTRATKPYAKFTKSAASLHGFWTNLNAIRAELHAPMLPVNGRVGPGPAVHTNPDGTATDF